MLCLVVINNTMGKIKGERGIKAKERGRLLQRKSMKGSQHTPVIPEPGG
jgi:hypothetical protein